MKGTKSPKQPKPPSPAPQGTASIRRLNPGIIIKQEFIDNAGIMQGFACIFDDSEVESTSKHSMQSSTSPYGNKDNSMVKQRASHNNNGKRERRKKVARPKH